MQGQPPGLSFLALPLVFAVLSPLFTANITEAFVGCPMMAGVAHTKATATATAASADGNGNGNVDMDIDVSSGCASWDELRALAGDTPVGAALNRDAELRKLGLGGPHVHNQLRLFGTKTETETETRQQKQQPEYTLYRDHAGWCPYCQKTMLLVEAKQIPIQIELVNMRSYGDKPQSFLRKVPNGMLPALEDNSSGRVALDSASIMEFLEDRYNDNDNDNDNDSSSGDNRMVPDRNTQPEHYRRYQMLMGLERELFRWWCTLMFRPESPPGPSSSGNSNPVANLVGKVLGGSGNNDDGNGNGNDNHNDDSYVSPSMRGFLDCLETVDAQLGATKGPYFLDYAHAKEERPTMVDFVYASHVERMLASCAYWKGMNLRDPQQYPKLGNLRRWIDALETHEYYLAFKSDYYTHVKDIPPQYGPSSNGVSRKSKIRTYQSSIDGTDGRSWTLPLADDDSLQPLGRGIPLPRCVLDAAGIVNSNKDNSNYESVLSTPAFRSACQTMAAWKLCGNGPAVARFAARGGPGGARNPRRTFGAELADPYAKADEALVDPVDRALRAIATTMLDHTNINTNAGAIPSGEHAVRLRNACRGESTEGIRSSLAYLRDRIGVPRDLPLASARYLRAYLNWGIDVLEEVPPPEILQSV